MSISSVLASSQPVSQSVASSLVAGSTTASSSGTASGNISGQTMTESDFLTLLVTQLQNQNPSQPVSNNQLAQEIAGFTTANGMTQADGILQQISNQISQLGTAAATSTSGSSTSGQAATTVA
ncbi:Putative flagellar hook capping protein FlgD [Acidithiobacillus ferrivorans]|jgi:flagellar basal-body rod modification protein FlgD|uniref:Basal-body rod modification protein FlgD n=1 Tax=Acidithiobacillus ferrivorans TaxID=160808 RepID=A0A060URU4_9PROT|nr:flagellar hook capping FlgD N-terminal domain-containing protein [Acidithiobacillus ferrivorans]QQD72022.1 hypothetical protein H2515_11390 [Acidithiobacillus ferrivorans]CDQ11155.1 exported hypothetical protein [Acidithiobacillus ferrivorans]SMH67516.1 Putative flagellar hook capping protein FlgD [Acidithiobacillus ferrivorans]